MLEKLIVLVEEYSMEAALEHLLPKLLGDIEYQIIRFQCKDDLLKRPPNDFVDMHPGCQRIGAFWC